MKSPEADRRTDLWYLSRHRLERDKTGPHVHAAVHVNADANACYEAFADPSQMTRFWFPRASGRMETGAEISWYLSDKPDAIEVPVRVVTADPGTSLAFDWGDLTEPTRVTFTFAEQDGRTTLRVTETGHEGEGNDLVEALLDSQGGFNQVVIAAKAWIEHGVAVNTVTDHAV